MSNDEGNSSGSDQPRPRKMQRLQTTKQAYRAYKNPPMKDIVPTFKEGSFSTLKVIFFDTETSGMDHRCHEILQISASTLSGAEKFNCYIRPVGRDIVPAAFDKHRLMVNEETGQLSKDGVDLPGAVSLLEALEQFLKFCSDVSPTNQIALVAHNAQFDAKFLMQALENENLVPKFEEKCHGFVDTMRAAQKLQPRPENGRDAGKATLLALHTFYGGDGNEDVHNSEVDVAILCNIWAKMAKPEEYLPFTFQLKGFLQYMKIGDNGKGMEPLLNLFMHPDIKVSPAVITKLATAGATMASLLELASKERADFIQAISDLNFTINPKMSSELLRAVLAVKSRQDALATIAAFRSSADE